MLLHTTEMKKSKSSTGTSYDHSKFWFHPVTKVKMHLPPQGMNLFQSNFHSNDIAGYEFCAAKALCSNGNYLAEKDRTSICMFCDNHLHVECGYISNFVEDIAGVPRMRLCKVCTLNKDAYNGYIKNKDPALLAALVAEYNEILELHGR